MSMPEHPYVLLSVAMSLDGYIDDSGDTPLVLSNAADLDRVDALRAGVDAILVGGNTVRRDNPSLLVKSEERRGRRWAAGLSESPTKVVVSGRADLDPASRFFTTGDSEKLLYVASPSLADAERRFSGRATVVDLGDPIGIEDVLVDLASRGVHRLMVEGGESIHTQILTANLADELQVAVAPFFVGDPAAPRFVGPGSFPQHAGNRMTLAEVAAIDDVVVMRFLPPRPSQGGG